MGKIRARDINVSGDGNAIGNNNQLTVVKNIKHHHHHRPCAGGGDERGIKGEPLLMLSVAVFAACVFGTYFFAKHAELIYLALQTVSGLEVLGVLTLIAAPLLSGDEDEAWYDPKLSLMLLVSGLSSIATLAAQSGYREELTTMAVGAHGAQAFWCGLSDYGRQFASLHALTASFGFGLGNLMLGVPIAVMLMDRFLSSGFTLLSQEAFDRLRSWGIVCFAAVPVAVSAYFQTDDGWNTWAGLFDHPPSFFCAGLPSARL